MSMARMLVVDDEEALLDALSRMLKAKGFETETVTRATAALEAVERFRPDVVLTDIMMPGMDGVSLARQIKRSYPDTSVIMMTAYASVNTAIESLKLGVDDYIKKPIVWDQAIASIWAALHRRATTLNNRKYVDELERKLLRAQNGQGVAFLSAVRGLFSSEGAARNSMLDTVESLAAAIGARDPVTKDHSRKVGIHVAKLAALLSFSTEEVHQFRVAGLLHDIGKISIPDEIICKSTGKMTGEEFDRYKEHPVISHKILQPIREFQPILDAVLHHHERFDGKGFPDKLSGANIPIGARMIAVANAFAYLGVQDAHDEFAHEAVGVECLMAERGTHFDPEIVDVFIKGLGTVHV